MPGTGAAREAPATRPMVEGAEVALAELILLRHRIGEVPLFSTPQRRSPLAGLHHSRLRGRGIDFDQVRVYQPGDDVRNIDWRVTARTQEPHTKLFHEERERPIYLLVEQSRRLFFGSGERFKSVLAAEAAALIGWAARAHNDRVGGLVFGDGHFQEVRPRRSKHSLLQLLARLAQANQALAERPPLEADSLGQALRRAREVLRPGSLAAVICDERALGDAAERQLLLLGRHVDLLLLPVSDPLDHALPAAGLLHFESADTAPARRLTLDTQDAALRQGYRRLGEARQARWALLGRRLGVPLLPLDSQRDTVAQLHEQLNAFQGAPR